MKIAIQAADLDNSRIDGTRVYLLNMLKYFGKISSTDEFFIYHKKDFNKELEPPALVNYNVKKIPFSHLWTQTRFAWEIWKDNPEVLWMPMHNIPFIRRKKLKTVVTIHDLAFKFFPVSFPENELKKLNFLVDLAIKKSDKIIAVSESTKRDILKVYASISPDKIKVIYHGFDAELFQKKYRQEEINKVLNKYKIDDSEYILYVGAIQPRKNLKTLITAFSLYKKQNQDSKLKLVLAGGKAWEWQETINAVMKSPFKDDIIMTEKVSFDDLAVLYKQASLFVFPSLYEGFGIPILEAFASGIPVITARNSSLPEIGGEAAEYFDSSNPEELTEKIKNILENPDVREKIILKGKEQIEKFSWEKCARETLEYLKS